VKPGEVGMVVVGVGSVLVIMVVSKIMKLVVPARVSN